jgi:hypothetical protein
MKGSALRQYKLDWNDESNQCFERIKCLLSNQVKLSHFDEDKQVCLFTDASHEFYGVMLTQNDDLECSKPIWDQKHSPLAFLSGKFNNSQLNWSTTEKEADPIVLAMKKLRHFLYSSKEFRLFTDHRNLVFVFNPVGTKKASTDRLLRWADLIASFRFLVEHIPGSYNVWADMLSRWRSPESLNPVLAHVGELSVPPTLSNFEWPTLNDIRIAQLEFRPIPDCLHDVEGILKKDGKV